MNGPEEWHMTPVLNEDGVPIFTVYRCPYCGHFSKEQYTRCPNPLCGNLVAED